jgi:hypothetical protein
MGCGETGYVLSLKITSTEKKGAEFQKYIARLSIKKCQESEFQKVPRI